MSIRILIKIPKNKDGMVIVEGETYHSRCACTGSLSENPDSCRMAPSQQ